MGGLSSLKFDNYSEKRYEDSWVNLKIFYTFLSNKSSLASQLEILRDEIENLRLGLIWVSNYFRKEH